MRSGGWLHKGKVLAPLMFVVLYENLLTSFAFGAITYLFLEERRVVIERKKRGILSTFFIDSERLGPLPTYP